MLEDPGVDRLTSPGIVDAGQLVEVPKAEDLDLAQHKGLDGGQEGESDHRDLIDEEVLAFAPEVLTAAPLGSDQSALLRSCYHLAAVSES